MKIALAQINPTVGDFSGNSAKILEYVARSVDRQADLVMFPELSVCGYWPADLLEKSSFIERAEASVLEIASATAKSGIAVLCGSVSAHHSGAGKQVSNTAGSK